jgi:hypothetical protein
LNPPGGGGSFDGMEPHIARLEEDMREIKADLKSMRADLAWMKRRPESLPTMIQMITLVFGILGGAFQILRFGLPHP